MATALIFTWYNHIFIVYLDKWNAIHLMFICIYHIISSDNWLPHIAWNGNQNFISLIVNKIKIIYTGIYIYTRLKIKPNSARIRFLSYQIFVLPATGFEFTPLIHCSTNRLVLSPAPYTTGPLLTQAFICIAYIFYEDLL